jgi:hypothetical protein
MRISLEKEIARPPETVFPWIAEPGKAMTWQRNVKGGEIILNKPGIIGTTFKEIIEEDGKCLEMHGTITQYVRNKTIGFHLKSRIHEVGVSYSVEGIEKGTKMSIEAIIRWKFPMNIVSLFIGKKMKAGLIEQMESETLELKRICESE